MTALCPRCGTPRANDTPGTLCPRCLLEQGLAGTGSSTEATPARLLDPATAAYSTGFNAPSPAELQALFPSLEILEFLGKGGMGAVYKARQISLDRLVALKILPPAVGRDPAFTERFGREARALAKLNHPHIVAVHDFGKAGDLYYFLMEFVDGVNLREAMRAGHLSPAQALQIVPQICDALQFAHDEGVVHRDIKPENLLLDKKGRVKIADFGLAKLLGKENADVALTGTQQGMGTVHYMAPEQVEGARAVDHRADIYSLGVTFYEMLTGELPIGRFAPPSQKVQIDVRLDDVVLRTLEKEPEKRYQHVSEVKTEVETIGGISPAAAQAMFGREYRSKATFLGWPLVHIAFGLDPKTGRKRIARGWIAIGDAAVGGLAMGGLACGGVAWGGVAVGLVGFGGVAVALLAALGGMAVGGFAFGGLGVGGVSLGGVAAGYYAYGGTGLAVHPMLGSQPHDPEAVAFFGSWKENVIQWGVWGALLLPLFSLLLTIFIWLFFRTTAPSESATDGPAARARRAGGWLLAAGIFYWVVPALLLLGGYAFDLFRPRSGEPVQALGRLLAFTLVAAVFNGTLMIAAGTRLMRFEQSGLLRFAAMLALIPMTPAWLLGLPAGLLTLLTLGRSDVQEEFERREVRERARAEAKPRRPDHESPWFALGEMTAAVVRSPLIRFLTWTALCVASLAFLGLPSYADRLHTGSNHYGYLDRWYWPYRGTSEHRLSLPPTADDFERIVLTERREIERLGWGRSGNLTFTGEEAGRQNGFRRHEIVLRLDRAGATSLLTVDVANGLTWESTDAKGQERRGDSPIDLAVVVRWMEDAGLKDILEQFGQSYARTVLALLLRVANTEDSRTLPGAQGYPNRLERIAASLRQNAERGQAARAFPFSDPVGADRATLEPVFSILWVSVPIFLVLWLGGLRRMLRTRAGTTRPLVDVR